jgi:tetratricopeptide (TPR) repeat protein
MDRDAEHWEAVEEASELLQQEAYEAALRELRDVMKRDPTNPYAYYLAATALYELERLEPARDAYRAALRLSPNYLGARVGLSHVLRRLGDYDGAIEEAAEALSRFPGDPGALHASGLALAARGKRPQARADLQRFLGTGPELEAQLEVRSILEMLGIGEDDEPIEFD